MHCSEGWSKTFWYNETKNYIYHSVHLKPTLTLTDVSCVLGLLSYRPVVPKLFVWCTPTALLDVLCYPFTDPTHHVPTITATSTFYPPLLANFFNYLSVTFSCLFKTFIHYFQLAISTVYPLLLDNYFKHSSKFLANCFDFTSCLF